MNKLYDFIVFGATGFTGKFVCEELQDVLRSSQYNYKWAMAGRTESKLQNILDQMVSSKKLTIEEKANVGIIIADINNQNSLVNMCQQGRVILDCVGPYKLYGEQVVKACIEGKADFLDISGEPQYLNKILKKYKNDAEESEVYVIGACGFDSIPSDLGVIFAKQQFQGTLNSLDCYFTFRGGPDGITLNHGTYASMVHAVADSSTAAEYRKLKETSQVKVGPSRKVKSLHYNRNLKCYAMPFPGPDAEIVKKSQLYLYDNLDSMPVQYNMYISFKHFWQVLGIFFFFIAVKTFSLCRCGKNLLLNNPKAFSFGMYSFNGPTDEQIKHTSFTFFITGRGYSDGRKILNRTDGPDKKIYIQISGPELAYVTTPITMVQAAVMLLGEREKIPNKGGTFTTGAAFSQTSIIARMHERGVKFEVINED